MILTKQKLISTSVNTIFFLAIVGFSLPVPFTWVFPLLAILGIVILLITIIFSKVYLKVNMQLMKITKRFNNLFLIYGFLLISILPGMIFSLGVDFNYGFLNILSLIRIFIYILGVFFIASLISEYKIDPKKGIILGFIFTGIFNIYDYYFSGANYSYSSLKGENDLGFSASIVFSIIIGRLISTKKISYLNIFLLVFTGIVSLLSWSKSSWLVIIFFTFVLLLKSLKSIKAFFYFSLSALFIFLAYLVFNEQIVKIITVEYSSSLGGESNQERIRMLQNALKIFTNYPLGVGNNTYPIVNDILGLKPFQYKSQPPDPHNAYAQVLVGAGFFGFSAYLTSFYLLFKKVLKLYSTEYKYYIYDSSFALLACFIQGFFTGITFTQPITWLITAWLLSALNNFYNKYLEK